MTVTLGRGRRLGEERGLIISTHSLEEVEAVCTRAIVIDHGRILADKEPKALIEEHGSSVLLRIQLGGDSL